MTLSTILITALQLELEWAQILSFFEPTRVLEVEPKQMDNGLSSQKVYRASNIFIVQAWGAP